MKLTDLEPVFLRYQVEHDWPTEVANDPMNYPVGGTRIEFRDRITFHKVDSINEAQGVEFLCPKCAGHIVICWSRGRGVPDSASPSPGRWALEGTGMDDLTLGAEVSPTNPDGKRSVQLTGEGCNAHFNVTNGEVVLC